MRTRNFRTLQSNIFIKTKKGSRNRFCLFESVNQKNEQKSRDTVSLKKIQNSKLQLKLLIVGPQNGQK